MNYSVKKTGAAGFGIMDIVPGAYLRNQLELYTGRTRMLFIRAKGCVNIDFTEFDTETDRLFFIRSGQYIQIPGHTSGIMLHYDEEHYFKGVNENYLEWKAMLFGYGNHEPSIGLVEDAQKTILSFYTEIRKEAENQYLNQQETISTLIKQLIVTSMRLYTRVPSNMSISYGPDLDFYRKFNSLVDEHFRQLHSAAEFAKICSMTTKTLNKKISKYSDKNPSEIIYKRIILEAKRMLVQTQMNVRDIAFLLGYEDYSYFIRFFVKHTGIAPQTFRRCHNQSLTAVA